MLLQKQKAQTDLQKTKVEQTLEELKVTQSQLVHSEKMASLGELTAGIAHEIQNPLNFVNNFSDINKELLVEMNEEISKQNFHEVTVLSRDVKENEEKINYTSFIAAAMDRKKLINRNILWEVFKTFDTDETGYISIFNIEKAIERTGKKKSFDDIKYMFKAEDRK